LCAQDSITPSLSRRIRREESPVTENDLASIVVDAALSIHRQLGPGLLESAYETILDVELTRRGLTVARQVSIPLVWQSVKIDVAFRADLIVNSKLIVEVKSVERLVPVHKKQLLTYLRLADLRLGILLNFGSPLLRDGIERVINGTLK
jgi:GxxExxY protein